MPMAPLRRREIAQNSNPSIPIAVRSDEIALQPVSSPDRPLVVTVDSHPTAEALGSVWRELESRSERSFFISWSWIGPWLLALADTNAGAGLRMVTVRDGDTVVGLAILGRGPRQWRTLGRRPVFLHQTGDSALDVIYVEFNDVMVTTVSARNAMFQALGAAGPVQVQAGTQSMLDGLAASATDFRIARTEQCPFVDLIRHACATPTDDLLAMADVVLEPLSRNTRQQIRRALRLAQADGALRVVRASSGPNARAALDEMIQLHAAAWGERKGLPGAFTNSFMNRFSTLLVDEGVAAGTIDLLRIEAGTRTIGILLNLVDRGEVYSYQSGFAYSDDNRMKPGLVSHVLALAFYKISGLRGYHFMAGHARYKTDLSNATEALYWVEIGTPTPLMRIESVLRDLWRRLRAAMSWGGRTTRPE